MLKWIVDVLIVLAVAVIIYFGATFLGYINPETENPQPAIDGRAYTRSELALSIAQQINTISPTPPTSQSWIVEQIDFVNSSNNAYVIYHDTHNIFRILVNRKNTSDIQFVTKASFEPESIEPLKWKLIAGEDLSTSNQLTSYILDPELQAWTERK